MRYALVDISGNLVDSFRDEMTARAALEREVGRDGSLRDTLFVVSYDETGQPVGDAVTLSDIHRAAHEAFEAQIQAVLTALALSAVSPATGTNPPSRHVEIE